MLKIGDRVNYVGPGSEQGDFATATVVYFPVVTDYDTIALVQDDDGEEYTCTVDYLVRKY